MRASKQARGVDAALRWANYYGPLEDDEPCPNHPAPLATPSTPPAQLPLPLHDNTTGGVVSSSSTRHLHQYLIPYPTCSSQHPPPPIMTLNYFMVCASSSHQAKTYSASTTSCFTTSASPSSSPSTPPPLPLPLPVLPHQVKENRQCLTLTVTRPSPAPPLPLPLPVLRHHLPHVLSADALLINEVHVITAAVIIAVVIILIIICMAGPVAGAA
jgi:hypothetical protein